MSIIYWPETISGQHRKLNVAHPSINLPSLYVIQQYSHTELSIFCIPFDPMGECYWTWSLIREHCTQISMMTIDFAHWHIASPIICHWGPHGGKSPHRSDIGAPIGAPMGPHGVPHGAPLGAQWGPISPMGTIIFSYPILKGKNPTQKIVAFCVGCHGPLLCLWEVWHSSCQRLQSYAW